MATVSHRVQVAGPQTKNVGRRHLSSSLDKSDGTFYKFLSSRREMKRCPSHQVRKVHIGIVAQQHLWRHGNWGQRLRDRWFYSPGGWRCCRRRQLCGLPCTRSNREHRPVAQEDWSSIEHGKIREHPINISQSFEVCKKFFSENILHSYSGTRTLEIFLGLQLRRKLTAGI